MNNVLSGVVISWTFGCTTCTHTLVNHDPPLYPLLLPSSPSSFIFLLTFPHVSCLHLPFLSFPHPSPPYLPSPLSPPSPPSPLPLTPSFSSLWPPSLLACLLPFFPPLSSLLPGHHCLNSTHTSSRRSVLALQTQQCQCS